MLVNSTRCLYVLAKTGNFISVIYTLIRMDYLKQFILLEAQPLELQHSHIFGHIQLIKHQLFYIMGAILNAKVFILVDFSMNSAIYSK